jgi:hypothetical protein
VKPGDEPAFFDEYICNSEALDHAPEYFYNRANDVE